LRQDQKNGCGPPPNLGEVQEWRKKDLPVRRKQPNNNPSVKIDPQPETSWLGILGGALLFVETEAF